MSATAPHPPPDQGPNEATGRTNGLTDEQVKQLLAAAGRRKDDPGYVERLMEGVAEYRHRIQKELERELADEKAK